MNIAVNTRLLLKGRLEGIGRFSHEILKRLVLEMPEHTFYFIFDRPYDEEFIYASNVKGLVASPQARHPLLYQAWFEWSVPRTLRSIGADLFLSPEGYLSMRTKVPCINVIHDINFLHHPEMLDRVHRWHFNRYFPQYAHKAVEVITVSEYSRQDIIAHYDIAPEKIQVVSNGVSDSFTPLSEVERVRVRSERSSSSPFFVFVGSLHPRKNLARLLKAFDRFKADSGLPHKLLIIGKRAFMNREMDHTFEAMKHGSDVIFTGRLEDQEMIETLASAEALTFVPLFEGFGMPIIEAFSCGVPVIASDISALPEVTGQSALLVDPLDEIAIANAMLRIAQDPAARAGLVQQGLLRAKDFDWDRSAKQIAGIITKHLG